MGPMLSEKERMTPSFAERLHISKHPGFPMNPNNFGAGLGNNPDRRDRPGPNLAAI